jgi:WD40 repeat protein
MWDVETGICSRTLSGHAEKWPKIAFSPQGTQVASADNDGMVRLWNVETGECHELSDAINGRYRTHAILACSPKGDRIAYGHAETVFLWDTQSAACLQRLSGHKQLIFGMAFSPHGDLIACADSGMTMRIWDAVSGKCRAVIRSFDDHVYSIAWTQSSGINYLVAGSKDGMVGMWQVTVDGERCHVRQHWRTTKGEFVVEGTDMRGVQGLSLPNMRLMEQHGAKIGPLHDLDEANVSGTSVEDPDEASVSDTSEEDPDE